MTEAAGAAPPDWWPAHGDGVPLFAAREWFDLFAGVRSQERHHWIRTVGDPAGRVSMIRGTWVDGPGARRSLDPRHWLYEQTAYRDGRACPEPPSGPDRIMPSLVFVYPGLDFQLVGDRDPDAVRTVFEAAVDTARRLSAASVAFGFVQPDDPISAGAAAALGFRRFTMATLATLELAGRSAEQVFSAYSTKQRASLRRTRRRLAERGAVCRVLTRPEADLDRLAELRCRHLGQHGRTPSMTEERAHLASLLERFGHLVTVLVAIRDGEIRAFSLFLLDGDTWHAYMTGRQDVSEDRDVYFELNYYLPTELATGRGHRRISYGYGTEEAKRLRGCQLQDVHGHLLLLEGADRDSG